MQKKRISRSELCDHEMLNLSLPHARDISKMKPKAENIQEVIVKVYFTYIRTMMKVTFS